MTVDSAPPGVQAEYERWSLVFFTRPGNSKVLRALVDSSHIIAEAVKKRPEKNFETGSTAAEWFARRIKNQRINNRLVSTPSVCCSGCDNRYRNIVGTRNVGYKPRDRAYSDTGLGYELSFPVNSRSEPRSSPATVPNSEKGSQTSGIVL